MDEVIDLLKNLSNYRLKKADNGVFLLKIKSKITIYHLAFFILWLFVLTIYFPPDLLRAILFSVIMLILLMIRFFVIYYSWIWFLKFDNQGIVVIERFVRKRFHYNEIESFEVSNSKGRLDLSAKLKSSSTFRLLWVKSKYEKQVNELKTSLSKNLLN